MEKDEIQDALDWFASQPKKPLLFDFAPPVKRCKHCDYPFGLDTMESLEKLRRCPDHSPTQNLRRRHEKTA